MSSDPSVRSPNLLLILTDQQRFDALSVHGGLAKTPNLDRLAAEGVDLTQHYSQSPVCVPSRAVLFTGRYPGSTGVGENHQRVRPEDLGLFTRLEAAGYRLGYLGKDHLFPTGGRPSFERWHDGALDPAHPRYAAADALRKTSYALLEACGCHASGLWHDFPNELTTSGVIGSEAVAFLQEVPADRPFFLVASFFDPHVPHLAPERFRALYDESAIEPPATAPDPVAGKHARFAIKRAAQKSDQATRADRQHYLAIYAAMVSHVDEQVGRILAALAERPDPEDTVVVFTSDHGDFGFDHGMSKKDLVLLDALLHVPFIVRLPGGRSAGGVRDTLTEHVDLAPTLLDLVGLPVDPGMQGRSLGPLLFGERREHKSVVHATACPPGYRNPYFDFSTFRTAWTVAQGSTSPHPLRHTASYNVPGDHCRSIRTAEWKLICFEDGFEELYDLWQDPGEWHNLASAPEHGEVRARLRRLLVAHEKETRDFGFRETLNLRGE